MKRKKFRPSTLIPNFNQLKLSDQPIEKIIHAARAALYPDEYNPRGQKHKTFHDSISFNEKREK